MQVPERLAIIGGSVLLSSGLIFGLKGSASTLLPKIEHPVYEMTASDKQKQQDAHNQWWNSLSDYDKSYETAKQNGQKTGTWGSSKYYIDNDHMMHVGSGQVQGNASDLLGNSSNDIKGYTFDSNAQHSSDNTMNSNDVQKRQEQEAHDKWWNGLSDFDKGNETAKQNNWQTGMWGTSKYYIDNNNTLHVGDGTVQGNTSNLLGDKSNDIKGFAFSPNVKYSSDNLKNSNTIKQEQQAANSSSSSNSGSSYVPPSSYTSGGGSNSAISNEPTTGPGEAMGHAGDNNGGLGNSSNSSEGTTGGVPNSWFPPAPKSKGSKK